MIEAHAGVGPGSRPRGPGDQARVRQPPVVVTITVRMFPLWPVACYHSDKLITCRCRLCTIDPERRSQLRDGVAGSDRGHYTKSPGLSAAVGWVGHALVVGCVRTLVRIGVVIFSRSAQNHQFMYAV